MNTIAWHQKLYMIEGKVDFWVKHLRKSILHVQRKPSYDKIVNTLSCDCL